jgi:sigma-E factor negative regulatory protein RseB
MIMAKIFPFPALKANSPLLAFLLFAGPVMPVANAQEVEAPRSEIPGPVSGNAPIPQKSTQTEPVEPAVNSQPGDAEIQGLLSKLANAVTNLEYRGFATFEHAGVMESVEVVHGIRSGEPVERIRFLTGAPREMVSRGGDAQCRRDGSPLSRAGLWSNVGLQNVQGNYQFVLRGEERIADRDAVVLEARPRDVHRFGMVVSVDRETGLPLKSLLVTPTGRLLERFQFVELDLAPIADSDLQPQSESARESDGAGHCGSLVSRWQLDWVPNGFKAVAARELADGEMQVFSDGLSAFTVFVQKLGPNMNYRGRAVRGATVAYMDHIEVNDENYTVTVVGEIPDNTALLVAKSVKSHH